jgi:ubiquinol-cytochrome c reductase cytochrome c1 subunit
MMKRFLLTFALLLLPLVAFAEGELKIALSEAPIDTSDIESIKRGARFFAANCMSCHTLVYLRYDSLAQEAGVSYDKMPVNVKNWPYGVIPPDLSLEADFRGVDWIYTYLHSFYQDTGRPTGVNNLLVPNTAMPGIITPFQGTQTRIAEPLPAIFHSLHWYDLVVLQKQGSMSPDQFDKAIADVVNFLAYSANPYQATQHAIGWWVVGFLLVLFVLSYFLKREYWKDIDRKNKN